MTELVLDNKRSSTVEEWIIEVYVQMFILEVTHLRVNWGCLGGHCPPNTPILSPTA